MWEMASGLAGQGGTKCERGRRREGENKGERQTLALEKELK